MTGRALVHGLAITGASTVRALLAHGYEVEVTDDVIDDERSARAASLGVALQPLPDDLDGYVRRFDLFSPAPGVPETHELVLAAQMAGVELVSEIELAYRWEAERAGGPRPLLAITGTDGKTTTTEMVVAMLRAAGHRTEALGNSDVPLLDALDGDHTVLVVECSSFRLAWTERFRADGAVWLNLAPDHLNWHASMDSYVAAKERIFALQEPGDVAIGFAADPIVADALGRAPGRRRSFALTGADYHLAATPDGDILTGPDGPIVAADRMRRRLPHDVTNALAASALVLETALADADAVGRALATFEGPPHRLQRIASVDSIDWFDDSKATTPHAAATAIRAFDSLVLIAGGSRKGVDLSPMAAEPWRIRAVVAIGEASTDVRRVFEGSTTVVDADSMESAVRLAAEAARAGDAVVLSPGCASFDWYTGYPARGDDFTRLAREHLGLTAPDREACS